MRLPIAAKCDNPIQWLVGFIRQNDMTFEMFSELMGLGSSIVSGWVNGKTVISVEYIVIIERVFGLEEGAFYGIWYEYYSRQRETERTADARNQKKEPGVVDFP